jgi:hypothetical protein
MTRILSIILALSIFAVSANAAEGRRTAAVGGFILGAVSGFLVRDAMATPAPAPQPQVVYVESQPRTVIVEAPPRVVYVERQPQVVYVERKEPRTVVYVKVRDNWEVREWTPPKANPFPQ